MGVSIDLLRAFTIPGLESIKSKETITFKAWVTNTKFKVTEEKQKDSFILDVYEEREILAALAFDINRMANSSFESIAGITKESNFPKSIGWLIIRLYYSSYFSTHALLRFFGISCTQIDGPQASAINKAYNLYQLDPKRLGTSAAYYECKYVHKENKVYGRTLSNTHQDVWYTFYQLLEKIAEQIPTSDFLKTDRDESVTFLFELRKRLSKNNTYSKGNWLSNIRNNVNYSHTMGAWFPYSGSRVDHEKALRLVAAWTPKTENLTLYASSHDDVITYIETCLMITSLAKELILNFNSLFKKTFLSDGAIKCLNECAKIR